MAKHYSARINEGQFSFENLDPDALDLIPVADGQFHLLLNNRSYLAEILAADYEAKIFTIRINGRNYQVQLTDHYDQLIERLGLKTDQNRQVAQIEAPMPGLVLEINAEEGQSLPKGAPLLILEAMKMENVIKAPADVVVTSIQVSKGEAVNKNQVLMTFDTPDSAD